MRVLRALPLLFVAACAAQLPAARSTGMSGAAAQTECKLSPPDQAWVDEAMQAWTLASTEITGIGNVEKIQAIFFDERCVVTSDTAMNGGADIWSAALHRGRVQVPGGPALPPGVISFAMGGEGKNLFVMSTPSVWRAANTSDNGLGKLETLMTAVVIHEATHVAQIPTYGKRMERLAAAHALPEEFNDDSIQQRFKANAEFADSVARETALLLDAAAAPDMAEARRLAGEARRLMKARQRRWFAGEDAHLAEAEDIWLTMEGSAQWAAYQWAIHPQGGRLPPARVLASFSRGRWWSQVEGFALFLALDRLNGAAWKRHAFGHGAKTGLQLLDEALAG